MGDVEAFGLIILAIGVVQFATRGWWARWAARTAQGMGIPEGIRTVPVLTRYAFWASLALVLAGAVVFVFGLVV